MAFADKDRTIQYNREYNEQNYDRLAVTVAKGDKEHIRQQAARQGESINGYINRLIKQDMSK